ncbi:MAG: TraR/DksA family transcriptional regulator [Deltaproteobacteria bacterium]|nr:TraR/DksA family transcriptional regulator [Deltaproteobacteria bacterium]
MSGMRKKAKKTDKKTTAKKVLPKKASAKKVSTKKAPPKKKPKPKKAQVKKTDVRREKTPRRAEPKKTQVTPRRKADFRATFLESLQEKKEEIKDTLDRLRKSRSEYSGQLTAGEFIDEVDDAQREISAYSHYSLIERKIAELRKVDLLIERVSKDEEFGLCEECGNPIPKERLMILPEATLCVPCQRELEKMDQRRSMLSRGTPSFGTRREVDWEPGGGSEEDENLLIEYHIGSLPEVDIEESEVENQPEEKEEKE